MLPAARMRFQLAKLSVSLRDPGSSATISCVDSTWRAAEEALKAAAPAGAAGRSIDSKSEPDIVLLLDDGVELTGVALASREASICGVCFRIAPSAAAAPARARAQKLKKPNQGSLAHVFEHAIASTNVRLFFAAAAAAFRFSGV